jgi:competence protein ComEA
MRALLRTLALVATLLVGASAHAAPKLTGLLNLNQATATQLDLLPGVGEKVAQRIITYRDKTPFRRVEELVKVKGFGKKRFEKLRPYLSVTGATTLVRGEATR